MDSETRIDELKGIVSNFCKDRDWDPFHGAKDLAIGAVTEASELLEEFRFLSPEEVELKMKDPCKRENVGRELADVLFFLLRFAEKYQFSLSEEFHKKMQLNALKYPVSEYKGNNEKSKVVL